MFEDIGCFTRRGSNTGVVFEKLMALGTGTKAICHYNIQARAELRWQCCGRYKADDVAENWRDSTHGRAPKYPRVGVLFGGVALRGGGGSDGMSTWEGGTCRAGGGGCAGTGKGGGCRWYCG